MQTTLQLRQGDVLLVQVPDLPDGPARPAVRGNHLLALGEVTHHAHYVAERDAVALAPVDATRRIAEEFGITDPRAIVGGLRVREATTLWHGTPTQDAAGPRDADHAPLALPVGNYLVIQPREFDDADDFRRVAD